MSLLGMQLISCTRCADNRLHPLRPRLSISRAIHRYFGGIDIPIEILSYNQGKCLGSMGIVYPRLNNVHHILDDLGSVHLRKSLRICRSLAYLLSSDYHIRILCKLCIWSCLLDCINPCKLRSIRHRSRWVARNKVFRE